MSFLAPSLLLGLIAAGLPWLIHLIGRRKARPVQFAAMELLMRAERQVSARRRLRDALLLITRTATAAALPLIFAKPFTEAPSDLPAAASLPQSAVIVLDDSASLRRRVGGGVLFDAARARARALAVHFAAESDVALVLASEGTPTPIGEPSSDRGRLLATLDAVSCSARPADFGAALRRAAQILGSSERKDRRIYLITDMQATGWEGGDGLPGPVGLDVVVLDVSDGAAWDNRAVVALAAEPTADAGERGVAVVAEIANYADTPATNLGVTLRLDGAAVARGFVDVPAAGRAKKRFVHTLTAKGGGGVGASASGGGDGARSSDGGSHVRVEVAIDGDSFPLDDVRAASAFGSRGLRALVINGDARTVRTEDETFFLETALRASGSGLTVTTALPDDLDGRALGDFAAVFIANVAQPSTDLADDLVGYVESGGGLFISVGDRVDADVWNQRLGRILPQPFGLRRTAAAAPGPTAEAEAETVDTRPAERLAPIDRRHPMLTSFPARGEGLASARFFRFLLLDPVPEAPQRRVILRYENGAPALVEADVGRGRVMVLSTTVDRDWTDLPIRPGFLPLIQEAARRLSGAPAREAASASPVGQPREIEIESDDQRVEVTRPDGSLRVVGRESLAGRKAVVFTETDQPGFYGVRAAGSSGQLAARPEASFVVNLDPRESDTARLPADRRPDRKPAAAGETTAPRRRVELWHALGAALIAFILVESLLTLRRPLPG